MKRLLFANIKRWIIEFGMDIKDLLLNVVTTESEDNLKRYGSDFYLELNKHFTSRLFGGINFYEHLPLLLLDVHDVGYSNPCFHQYILAFTFSFTTISADQEKQFENTPEDIYQVIDDLECYLNNMMLSFIKDNQTLDDFEYKLEHVVSVEQDPLEFLNTDDEIITVTKQYTITQGECNGYF